MIFIFSLQNHTEFGQRTLHDVIMILIHQLRALGHVAEWSKGHVATSRDAVNVIVEGFLEKSADELAFLRRQGARFLCIATEEPTPAGFNHGIDQQMIDRQAAFPAAAENFAAIWALVPGAAEWYSRYAPACHVELGYAKTLVRRPAMAVDHEFGFYGSLTERRLAILKRLGDRSRRENGVKVLAGFQDQAYRDAEMSRAKVIVQVRAVEAMGLVSSSRCNTAMHLGRPVVAEPHELSHPWDEVIHFSRSTSRFYEDAMAMRRGWQHKHTRQFERFKALFSPERTVGKALVETDLLNRLEKAA
jgi:hypothetical protein